MSARPQGRGTPLRIIGYIRTSTETQTDNGHGADVQREQIQAWAEERGCEIVLELTDDGQSRKLADRSALGSALRALKERRADGITVQKLDRLSRDLILQEQLIAEIWQHGTLFSTCAGDASVLEDDDPDDPTRKLVRRTIAAIPKFEGDMLSLQVRTGLHPERRQGGYAGGFTPFGFGVRDSLFEPDPETAPIVVQIFTLAGQGVTPGEIARRLGDVPTPQGGKAWSRQAIHALLRNERYLGTIVSRRRWNAAQRALAAKARTRT